MMTRGELEIALDAHMLWVRENWKGGPRWYLLRRNGKTRTWKRDKDRWEVPCKYKLHAFLLVTNTNLEFMPLRIGKGGALVTHKPFLDPKGSGLESDPGNPLDDERSLAYFDRYIAGDR